MSGTTLHTSIQCQIRCISKRDSWETDVFLPLNQCAVIVIKGVLRDHENIFFLNLMHHHQLIMILKSVVVSKLSLLSGHSMKLFWWDLHSCPSASCVAVCWYAQKTLLVVENQILLQPHIILSPQVIIDINCAREDDSNNRKPRACHREVDQTFKGIQDEGIKEERSKIWSVRGCVWCVWVV